MAAKVRLHWIAFTAEECEDLFNGVVTPMVRERIGRSCVEPLSSFVHRRTGDLVIGEEQQKRGKHGRRRSIQH